MAYYLKISHLAYKSGRSNFTLKSILLKIALSKYFFQLVAQINITSLSLSKLSNFLNKTLTNFLLTSWESESLEIAKASISSIKINDFPNYDDNSKIYDKFYSASPYHLLKIISIGIYINGIPTYVAIILAEVVFPVPGGPSNNIAFGLFH